MPQVQVLSPRPAKSLDAYFAFEAFFFVRSYSQLIKESVLQCPVKVDRLTDLLVGHFLQMDLIAPLKCVENRCAISVQKAHRFF